MADPLVLARRGRLRTSPATRWWGRAWLRSCEELALDPDDLAAGGTLARSGRFGAVVVIAGMASAVLDPSDDAAVVAQVKVAPLDDEAWEAVVPVLAGRSGHVADLEAGQLPAALVDATDELGVELLPDAAALETACECDAWAQPCTHALGLAVLLAWAVDEDPWVLMLLRGRTREALLDAVAAELDDGGVAALVDDAAARADRVLRLAERAPTGHGLADTAVAAYDEQVARLL
ncbi:MAG TPA: hypothetical protein VFM09_09775 [Marmoricola sp.]|nr:hypothetical protein [Marmoricola sp.]